MTIQRSTVIKVEALYTTDTPTLPASADVERVVQHTVGQIRRGQVSVLTRSSLQAARRTRRRRCLLGVEHRRPAGQVLAKACG